MSSLAEVIVVGGGVMGCSIAYYLAKKGVKVTVLEMGQIGGQASGAAAGMLAPFSEIHSSSPSMDMNMASLRMYEGLAAELKEESGIDVEYVPSGLIRLAKTDEEEKELTESLSWQREHSPDLRWLTPQELKELEPSLSLDVRGASYSPEEGHVQSPRLTQAFGQAALRLGATLRPDTAAIDLTRQGFRITGVQLRGEVVAADHVVLAPGAWTETWGHRLGVKLPVQPMRGQIMSLKPSSPSIKQIVVWGRNYMVPKVDGSVLVGATVEHVGFDTSVTSSGLAFLTGLIPSMAPSLEEAAFVGAWAGLRPWSEDGIPLLGPIPGWEGITMASGHYRNGILIAPLTGKLIAQSVLKQKTDFPLEPFSPARFMK